MQKNSGLGHLLPGLTKAVGVNSDSRDAPAGRIDDFGLEIQLTINEVEGPARQDDSPGLVIERMRTKALSPRARELRKPIPHASSFRLRRSRRDSFVPASNPIRPTPLQADEGKGATVIIDGVS